MKRLILAIFAGLFIAVPVSCPMSVRAAGTDELSQEVSSQVDEMLADAGLNETYSEASSLSLRGIISSVGEAVTERLETPVKLLGMLLLLSAFSAVFRGLSQDKTPTGHLTDIVSVMAAVTFILPRIYEVYVSAAEVIERTGGFILVFVPAFAGLSTVCGGLTSAGTYNLMILGCSEVIVALSRGLLMPVLGIISALGISGSAFRSKTAETFAGVLRKVIVWGMTVTMSLFTGFVSLKCSIAGKADSALSKTARFVISGAVPVVGGAVSDAYSSVRGSFDVLRCSVGAAGTAAIVLILLPPVLELIIFRLVLWLGAAAADVFSAGHLSGLLRSFDSGLAIAQSLLVCYGLMFLISSAILIQAFD